MLELRSGMMKQVDFVFGWNCADECRDRCMWNLTSEVFQKTACGKISYFKKKPIFFKKSFHKPSSHEESEFKTKFRYNKFSPIK